MTAQAARTAAGRGLALTAALICLLIVTFLALHVPPVTGLTALAVGAFGTAGHHLDAISETLVEACPLLLTGLSVVVAWRAGLFSIGAEGQMLVGVLAAVSAAAYLRTFPAPVLTAIMLMCGCVAGALWAGAAAWLRTKRGVQEVISTIMLNYAALYLVQWMVQGPLQERSHVGPYSEPLPDAVLFARLIPATLTGGVTTRLHAGVLLALAAVPVVWAVLYRTMPGFQVRTVGQSAAAARVAGFPVERRQMQAMLLSGSLAGLAGVVELLGISGRLSSDFSPGWGYTAVPVALLGGLHAGGTLISALFFGALTAGSGNLERVYGVSSTLIYIVQATAVLGVMALRAVQSRSTMAGADS